MSGERYSLEEARQRLGISKSGLEKWMRREKIKATRDQFDMRLYWLSRAQLEQLAAAHRRTLADDTALDVQAIDAALTERIEALERWQQRIEQQLALLDAPRIAHRPARPPRDVSGDDSPAQIVTTDTLEGTAEGDVPADWKILTPFAQEHGVKPRTASDHVRSGAIRATRVGSFWYLTPEQQEAALRYWGK